jgi:hypothetical protein
MRAKQVSSLTLEASKPIKASLFLKLDVFPETNGGVVSERADELTAEQKA